MPEQQQTTEQPRRPGLSAAIGARLDTATKRAIKKTADRSDDQEQK